MGKIKRNRYWFPFSHMLSLFQENFILVEATSSHFFRVTTLTQQLLFQGSYFFRTAAVFSFFTFSEQSLLQQELYFQNSFFFDRKFYRAVTSWEEEVLYGNCFSELLFFSEKLLRIKISKKSNFFKAGTSTPHQLIQKSYILEKTDYSENQFPHYLLFLESCLFRASTFSKDAAFYKSYLFRRATFLQHTFWEEWLFHSYGSFHSYTSYLFVSN